MCWVGCVWVCGRVGMWGMCYLVFGWPARGTGTAGRGAAKIVDAQPSTDGLLGPAKVGRSGQHVVARRATWGHQTPVSEKGGGGRCASVFVVFWFLVSGWPARGPGAA